MKILALDCATAASSAAAWADGAVVAAEQLDQPRGQAEALLPLVERVRRAAGLTYAAFDRFAVTVGPGHFTGLRAGLAAARGLALAAGRPLVGVTTLRAIAAGVSPAERAQRIVLVALNSKRAQPFVQAFDADLRELESAAAEHVELYAQAQAARRGATRFVVAGDETSRLVEALTLAGADASPATAPPLPDARLVAALAATMPLPAGPPAPLYIHPVETTAPRPRGHVAS